MLLWQLYFPIQGPKIYPIKYSEFLEQLDSGNIESVLIQGSEVTGKLKTEMVIRNEQDDQAEVKSFHTFLPEFQGEGIIEKLKEQDVTINVEPSEEKSVFRQTLFLLLPWVIIIGIFLFIMRHTTRQIGGGPGGLFSFGESKAKLYDMTSPQITFKDVAGMDNVKKEMQEIIEFLNDPDKFRKIGAKIPKGVLLVGPPGTGKTLLARATAGEAGVPFFSITASEFVEMFVGVGASRVRDMFKKAKANKPSMIFIDEIDAIGLTMGLVWEEDMMKESRHLIKFSQSWMALNRTRRLL